MRPETSARQNRPGHRYYDTVRQRLDGKRAALSQAQRIARQAIHRWPAALGEDAFAATPIPILHVVGFWPDPKPCRHAR